MTNFDKNFGLSLVGVLVGFCFGQWTVPMTVLLVFNAIDFATGLLYGIYMKEITSKKMTAGLFKKGTMWLVLIMAHMLDRLLFNAPLVITAMAFIYISNEGISILENTIKLGVPTPDFLKNILKIVQEIGETSGESFSKKLNK